MTTKKLVLGTISLGVLLAIFLGLAPILPLPVKTQKLAMSVLYSDESYAEDIARDVASVLQSPTDYGFESQEGVVRWLNTEFWVTADGGSRQMRVEPELLGDTGWPTIVNSLKVTLTYNRDGSSTTHRYYLSTFGKY